MRVQESHGGHQTVYTSTGTRWRGGKQQLGDKLFLPAAVKLELPPHHIIVNTLATSPASVTTLTPAVPSSSTLIPAISDSKMADSMEGVVAEGEQPKTENVEQKAIAGTYLFNITQHGLHVQMSLRQLQIILASAQDVLQSHDSNRSGLLQVSVSTS